MGPQERAVDELSPGGRDEALPDFSALPRTRAIPRAGRRSSNPTVRKV